MSPGLPQFGKGSCHVSRATYLLVSCSFFFLTGRHEGRPSSRLSFGKVICGHMCRSYMANAGWLCSLQPLPIDATLMGALDAGRGVLPLSQGRQVFLRPALSGHLTCLLSNRRKHQRSEAGLLQAQTTHARSPYRTPLSMQTLEAGFKEDGQ